MHRETSFELFDPNWIELGQDRGQWRHSRYRFVLGELVRLDTRNALGFGLALPRRRVSMLFRPL